MSSSDRTRWVGGITTIIGLVTLSLAFAGGASAAQQAAVSAASCASNGWTDTVTIANSPIASNGAATVSGTGTALDGAVLPAAGGHQSVVLNEPLTVKSVTVAGTLSWAKGYHAPFTTTALQPAGCGVKPAGVQRAAANNATPNVPSPKYYVCKYVGTPGQNERLQTGNNPIDVSGNAIGEDPVVVGSFFNDAQGRSFVLAEDTGQTPPTIDDCPEPTSTVTATATTTAPGPTVTVTGPTQTVTVTQGVTVTATSTVTDSATTTVTGDPVTVQVPGPTVTVTVTPAATTSDTSTSDAKKVYVCKYVGKPGVDERLQTGQNPIDVSVNAIPEQPVVVGSFFADAQGRSFVLAFDTGQTPPTADDCPAVGVPPTQTTTVTAPGSTTTVTAPGSTTTETVTAPGGTVTVTVPAVTVTQTVPGCDPAGVAAAACPTTTVTETVTQTVAGPAVTQTITLPGPTQTVTLPGSTQTVTLPGTTETVVGPGSTETSTVTQAGVPVTVTVTQTVTESASCPPGAQVAGQSAGGAGVQGAVAGSLAYTGGGDDPMMSLLGGAMTAAGLTLLFMARKRWSPRRH